MTEEIEWTLKVTVVFASGNRREFLAEQSYQDYGNFVVWSHAKVDSQTLHSYSLPYATIQEIIEVEIN